MKKMLKAVSLTLAMLLLLTALVGCGAQKNQVNTEETKKPDSSSVTSTTQEATKAKEKVTLKMISYTTIAEGGLNQLNESFMKEYPWITIEHEVVASGDYSSLFTTRTAAKDVDLFVYMNGFEGYLKKEYVPQYDTSKISSGQQVQDGILLDLTGQSFLKNWGSLYDEGGGHTYNGKVYYLPTGSFATNGVYYNKAIFTQYGLTEPKTWDEFIQVCEKLKSNGVAPLTCGVKDGWPTNLLWAAIASATEKDPKQFISGLWTGERKYNDETAMKTWKRIEQLTPYWIANVAAVDMTMSLAQFVTGQAAMYVGGTWDTPTIAAAETKIDFGYFAIGGDVAPADGGPVQLKGKFDARLAGFGGTIHPEEVLLWMEYYSQPENYAKFIEAFGAMPCMSVSTNNEFLNSIKDKVKDFGLQFENLVVNPKGVGEYANNGFIGAKFLKVYGGDIDTIEKIADLAQQDWETALKQLESNK